MSHRVVDVDYCTIHNGFWSFIDYIIMTVLRPIGRNSVSVKMSKLNFGLLVLWTLKVNRCYCVKYVSFADFDLLYFIR